MGYINFSIPKDVVLRFQEKAHFDYFVETGTFRGETSFWAAHHFAEVHTIEIDPGISKETSSKPDCPENIHFWVGNSREVLPVLIKETPKRTIFWLDGHWCNMSEFGKEEECPVLDELRAIKDKSDSLILIDDARAFLGPLAPPHDSSQWPRIDDIFLLLKNQFPKSFVTIMDDVIYCIPADLVPVFDEYWKATFTFRFGSPRVRFLKKIGSLVKGKK